VKALFLNGYYIGIAVALLLKDILWLRVVMIFAGISMICYGISIAENSSVRWYILFVIINLVQIFRIYKSKKEIDINENIIDIYDNVFSDMTKKEFVLFWKEGKKLSALQSETLCKQDVVQGEIILVLTGKLQVFKNNILIAELHRGNFAAEMGYLTNSPASADVIAKTNITYMSWNRIFFDDLKKNNFPLYQKFEKIFGNDLIEKIEHKL